MQDAITLERETATEDIGDESPAFATATRGLMAGAIGTWALDRADWLMWDHEDGEARQQTVNARPNGEPPAHVVASKAERLLGLEPGDGQHAAAGQAVHFAIGIAPAIAYAFLRDRLPGRGVARGLLFGGSMFLVQDELMNSVSGLGGKPRDYPWQAHARGLAAHLIYGLVTELTLNAMEKSAARLSGRYQDPDAARATPDRSGN